MVECLNLVDVADAEDVEDAVDQAASFYPDADFYGAVQIEQA